MSDEETPEESLHSEDDDSSKEQEDHDENDVAMDDKGDEIEDADEKDQSQQQRSTAVLSKSWSITSCHVPTFTGGKVTHCRKREEGAVPFMLLPVGGDIAVVDAIRGVKIGALRGEDGEGGIGGDDEDNDEDEGLDQEAISSYALDHRDQGIMACNRNHILRHYSIDHDGKTKVLKTWGRSGHTLPVTHMEYHASDVFLATGSVDGTVRIWDVRGGYVTHVFRPQAGGEDSGGMGRRSITGLHWKDEMSQLILAIGRDDGSVSIHDLRDADNVVVLRDHISSVTHFDWWGEEFFVSTGRDSILSLWRVVPLEDAPQDDNSSPSKKKPKNKKKKLSKTDLTVSPKFHYRRIQSIPLYEQAEGMVIVPTDKQNYLKVATAGNKGSVKLWKAHIVPGETPELKLGGEQPGSEAFGEARGGYMGLVLNHMAVADHNKKEQMIAVDAEHNLSFLTSKLSVSRTIVGHNDEILDLRVIPNSESIVVATNSAQIRIFDRNNFSCHVLDGHTATVLCVETSPCGSYIASCGKDRTMRLWEVATGKCLALATGHTEPIGACGLSRKVARYGVGGKAAKNGGGAFCVTASMDRTLKRWNLPGPDELRSSEEPFEFEVASGIRAHEKDINIVSIAPNDSLVASGSQDKTVKLWNATDLSLRATLKGHKRGVWDCQFSPIDRVLATSSGDKTVKLWSLADFSCVRTFQGHLASVLRVRFLTTGLQLMSAGGDGLLKLWTIRTNECEATLDGHNDKVWALDMSPDGRTVVSGGADSRLAVWQDNTQEVEDEQRAEEAEQVLLDQKLANHMRHKEYGKALEIALQVDRPLQVLKVITAIIENELKENKGGTGLTSLQQHAKTWTDERVAQVLKYCRDWNTRARNASIAMVVVQAVVTSIPIDKLSSISGVPEILAGVTPYAERHFDRLDRLHTSSYLLDFTLGNLGSLDPIMNDDDVHAEDDFAKWEAKSKLVLPPKFVDGRVQVGGKTIVGRKPDEITDDSSASGGEGDEVETIGESSSSDDDSYVEGDAEMEEVDSDGENDVTLKKNAGKDKPTTKTGTSGSSSSEDGDGSSSEETGDS